MGRWSEARVLRLAPDDASAAAARRLTRSGSWSDTGSTERLVWGKCQGGGSTPYQVSVELSGPAFRCSCPSRKLPCKHALALLLMWVSGAASVADAEVPAGFAHEWSDGRTARSAAQQRRAAVADPAAAARRRADRLALMDGGMEDFALWLADLVRGGTAAARQQPYGWWDAAAARLVDAQLPGLAEQVRAMASELHRRTDWDEHLLATAGRWWTATRAWSRRDSLTPEAMADLRVHVGWAQSSADVRAADRCGGRFLVLGGHRSDDGRLQQQRTWLREATTGELVQVLDFAAGGATLAVPQLAGSVLDAVVARYPGSAPRRALFVEEPRAAAERAAALPAGHTIDEAFSAAAVRLARNPWSDLVPVVLTGVAASADGSGHHLRDPVGHRLDLVPDATLWPVLALTGGHPADLFGELEAGRFRPLSLAVGGAVVPL